MKVIVSKQEINKLRNRMRRAYPKERMEIILGKMSGSTYEIHLFDQVKHRGTRNACYIDDDELIICENEAESMGLVVLGSIHSHTFMQDAAPSEFDLDESSESRSILTGIVSIWPDKKTKRLKTKVRIWGMILPIEIQYH